MSERQTQSTENDIPASSWLEAVIRAAVIDWNSNPNKPEGDVSLHLTRALWPVIQEDRAQVWDECVEETHGLGWLHDFALNRNPYSPIPPGADQ